MKKKRRSFNIYFFIEYSTIYFLLCFYCKNAILGIQALDISMPNQYIDFVYLKNTGAAFSLLKDMNILLAVFASIVVLCLLVYVLKNAKRFNRLEIHGYSFLLAGVLSNTVERYMDGYVTDYIKLRFIDFPVFNVADIFINIGVVLVLIAILFSKKRIANA